MLRTMKGYDEYNTILLPPRQPGDRLPQEIMEAYHEQQRKKDAEEKEKAEAASAAAAGQADKPAVEETEGTSGPPAIAKLPPTASGARDGGKAGGSDVEEGGKDGKTLRFCLWFKAIIAILHRLRSAACAGDHILRGS